MRPMFSQSFAGQVLPIGFFHQSPPRFTTGELSMIGGLPYRVSGTIGTNGVDANLAYPWQTLSGDEYDYYWSNVPNSEIVIEFPTMVVPEGINIAVQAGMPLSTIEIEGWEERINPVGEWRRLVSLPFQLSPILQNIKSFDSTFLLRRMRVRGLNELHIRNINSIY